MQARSTRIRPEEQVRLYVEDQAHEPVAHVEKVASELVGPVRHDIWDVHCTASRWWVVSPAKGSDTHGTAPWHWLMHAPCLGWIVSAQDGSGGAGTSAPFAPSGCGSTSLQLATGVTPTRGAHVEVAPDDLGGSLCGSSRACPTQIRRIMSQSVSGGPSALFSTQCW